MNINLKQLSEDVADKLLKASLTNANKILLLTEDELRKIGNFSSEDIKDIFYLASTTVIKPISVIQEPVMITVGCRIIDVILGGGLVRGGITELSGESGCGKTQFCLRLALTAQNPLSVGGIDRSVLYICTEDNFPSKRLQQLINIIPQPFKSCREIRYGDRIYVEHIADVAGLKECLFTRLPKLLNTNTVGLLIIDSITAVFRSDYAFSEGIQRTKDLRSIGCQLHSLSNKYNLYVLCVNQVSASINDTTNDPVPALGLAWANLVTTRIVMKKYPHRDTKQIELVFSPHAKPSSCNYIINEFGVQGLS